MAKVTATDKIRSAVFWSDSSARAVALVTAMVVDGEWMKQHGLL